MWRGRAIGVTIFCGKTARSHLALAPLGTPPLLHCQRFARLHVGNDLVDLGAIKRALDAQDGGQHDHEMTVGHRQVTRGDISVRKERLDCFLALADQQGQPACLLHSSPTDRVS